MYPHEAQDAPAETLETIDDDMQTMDLIDEEVHEDRRIYTPPPRIAARFYKPSSSRRKSSAASSRRNSISSSAASHPSRPPSSHHAAAASSQSAYVAQHLRRASILEDRRARLADRAAHAEKVRLRAAIAKAATRSSTHTEERALAAQQAREKNLAEIGARCAEEVKRAKGIAESIKEKRERENRKLRKDMEDRLAEAERRREELLHKGSAKRTRSLSQMRKGSSPERVVRATTISEDVAIVKIQQTWRAHQRYKVLRDFTKLELTIDGVKATPFEQVVDLLAQERVMLVTAATLRVCGLTEGEAGSVNEMTAVRTFLSAFLILGHPAQVLSGKGDSGNREEDLASKARDLLITFETILSGLTAYNKYTLPAAQRALLSEAYATFYNGFIGWKARDSSALIDMMVLQFVELDSIWLTVKDSTEEAVTESYKEGIRENQLKLMVRIKRLAGATEGKRLITNAIRAARKAKAVPKASGDCRPRASEGTTSTSTLEEFAASESTVAAHLQTLTPPATPRRDASPKPTSHSDALRTSNSILPDNRIVVHELAMNREYRISLSDCMTPKNALDDLVFDAMRAEIAAGNGDDWVLAMAESVKSKLQRLLKPGNSMHNLIEQVLDTELVGRELRSGAFSYERFFSFMASILPKLCAPVRDGEVKELVSYILHTGDSVDRLRALLRFIDLMQLDYANFMLQQSAPELLKHAVTYETKRFDEDLARSGNALPHTQAAWAAAKERVLAEAARRDSEGVNLVQSRPTAEKMHATMLVDVFTALPALAAPIAETLELDRPRIVRIRGEILRIVVASAILLQCKNQLKRDVRAPWKTEAARVYSILEHEAMDTEAMVQGITAALESGRSMPRATKQHIRDGVTGIISAYTTLLGGSGTRSEIREPVARLLFQRLRTHLLSRISAVSSGSDREKLKAQSTALEALARLGLPEFGARVGRLVGEMARAGELDRQAHGQVYERLDA